MEETVRSDGPGPHDHQQSTGGLLSEGQAILDSSRKEAPATELTAFGSRGETDGLSLSTLIERQKAPHSTLAPLVNPFVGSGSSVTKDVFGAIVRIEAMVQGARAEVETLEPSPATATLNYLHRAMLKELGMLQCISQNAASTGEGLRR